MLKSLAANQNESVEQIDPEYLQKYFKKCLKNDKLQGIGFLVNYIDRFDVECGFWDINRFRSALNYYLNDNFNLNKVMIFCKFYTRFFQSRRSMAERMLVNESNEENYAKADQIFAEHHDVVDMAALQSYLIQKLGNKQVLDPLTKQDVVWEVIEFFTQDKEFYQMSKMFPNATIREEDIAQYLENHINGKNALEKTFAVALRLDSEIFCRQMLAKIQKSQIQNSGRIPQGFKKDHVKQLYVQLKASGQLEELQTSKELLFYLLKENDLLAEVIDFSDILKKGQSTSSDITHYYVSETLMQSQLRQGMQYEQAIDTVLGETDDKSSCAVVQRCKAIFLDKGPQAAIDFMRDATQEKSLTRKAREDFLVDLFDKSFPGQGENAPTYQEFKEKYLVGSSLASQLAKESLAAQKLDKIITEKSYDQIESIFQYYTLLRQEHNLVAPQAHFGLCVDNPELMKVNVDPKIQSQVDNIRSRRSYIEHQFAQDELSQIQDYVKVLEEIGLNAFEGPQGNYISHMKRVFEGYSLQDADEISKAALYFEKLQDEKNIANMDKYSQDLGNYQNEVNKLYKKMKAWNIESLEDFQTLAESEGEEEELVDPAQEKAFQKKLKKAAEKLGKKDQLVGGQPYDTRMQRAYDEYVHEEDFEFMGVKAKGLSQKDLEQKILDNNKEEFRRLTELPYDPAWEEEKVPGMSVKKAFQSVNMDKRNRNPENQAALDTVKHYQDQYFNQDYSLAFMSHNSEDIMKDSRDLTLIEMREQMLEAVTGRKKATLPIALDIFNKLRNQKVPTMALQDAIEKQDASVEDQIEKIEILLNNPQSPIISTIRHTQKYKTKGFEESIEHYLDQNMSRDAFDSNVDVPSIMADRTKLDKLIRETGKLKQTMDSLKQKLDKEGSELQKKRQIKARYQEWQKRHESKIKQDLDNKMQQRYEEFVEMRKEGHVLNRDQKLSIMRDTLTVDSQVENGQTFPSQALIPAFYAQDLVMFGIKRNYPDAVRLGEKILIENGEKMPTDMHLAVKNYMLKHSEQYYSKDAMRRSGPLDSASLYKGNEQKEESIFNMDDPYWQNLLKANQKREDVFRTPSIYSWDHKQDGLLGEIFDMDAFRRNEEELYSRM